jgi:trigger factor
MELKDYKGIAVERIVTPATEADADAEIARTQKRNARSIEVSDRAAQMDDMATIDYLGTVDGVAFEGGKAENYNLKLGSGQFIPGFEEQIVGHSIGEKFDVNVTFPAEYHSADLAGKAAVFAVTLHALKYDELPVLDDEFAKDVSEFDTFDAYKADVLAKINERNEKAADTAMDEKLMDALIERLEGDIPQVMFDAEAENMLRDYDSRLRMQGISLNDYFKYTGMTLDSMRAQMMPGAERQVKVRLALDKIVELEGIVATEEQINAEYEKIAQAYQMEVEKVKEALPADAIAKDVAVSAAVDFVRSNAVVTTLTEEPKAEEKPAKKPAAKKPAAKKPAAKKAEGEAEAEGEKKPAAKKCAAKKPAAKSDEAKPAAAKKPAAKKSTAKKEETENA